MKNLIETIAGDKSLSAFHTTLQQGGMIDHLSGHSAWTVFAPHNQAFAELSAITMESLHQDKPTLRSLLSYHLVEDELWMSTLHEVDFLRTYHGDELRIDNWDEIHINNALIVKPDIECSNGIIHIIDRVLLQGSPAIG